MNNEFPGYDFMPRPHIGNMKESKMESQTKGHNHQEKVQRNIKL